MQADQPLVSKKVGMDRRYVPVDAPYDEVSTDATGAPPGDVRFIRAGALTFAYIAQLIMAMIFTMALNVYVLGLGWAVYDPNKAFISWDWWRVFMPTLAIYIPGLMIYFLYQERKINWTSANGSGSISIGLGRSLVRVIYIIYVVMLALATGAAGVTFVFFMIDRSDCAGSDVCAGVEFSKTGSPAFIMLLVGSGVMCVIGGLSLILSFFINSASRDVYVANASALTTEYATPMGSDIASVEGGKAPGTSNRRRRRGRKNPLVFVSVRNTAPKDKAAGESSDAEYADDY